MHFLNTAYLLTGGNVGDRRNYLQLAVNLINDQCGRIVKTSALYETAPWGNANQATFLNQALEIQTAYTATELMRRLLNIEEQMGRERFEKNGPRTIDIDILL
ncbi:MAG: 2-amino-4-hydroxy-6-hydroxymethyldihydropteridine diphosphokinase, partial [Chitinophagaceae bacterium]